MSAVTSPSATVALGTLLDDKFRVCREVGRGGMAVVYEAENVDLGKRVAVKVLAAELANSKVVTERFMREARAAARIRSPYICDVYDVGTYQERPFLVMELLEGESLYERMARRGRLALDHARRIAWETALGLSQAHRANIVHRDLKPENLFLTRSGSGEERTKIVDFGLAKFYEPNLEGGEAARLTKEGALFGTPAYMSPEQAEANGQVDFRSDLWALGCIVYEMIVGRTVWSVDQGVGMILAQIAGGEAPIPSRIKPDLPPGFDAWFARALARDPEARFGGALEMAEALMDALRPAQIPTEGRFAARPPTHSTERLASTQPPKGVPPWLDSLVPPEEPAPRRLTLRLGAGLGGLALLASAGWWLGGRLELSALSPSAAALQPVETADYAQRLAQGQQQLALGDLEGALSTFEEAFGSSNKKAARSLRSHALATAERAAFASCDVRGLGHPRPFEVRTESSSPSVALGSTGLVAAWASKYEEGKARAVFATNLDPLLRRVGPATLVTPEAHDASAPILIQSNPGRYAVVYADDVEGRPAVWVRGLSRDGGQEGSALRLSGVGAAKAHSPAVAPAPGREHWVVYVQSAQDSTQQLFARKLSAELEPLAAPLALTALPPSAGEATVAAESPSAAIDDGALQVVFVRHRDNERQVVQMRTLLPAPLPARPRGLDSRQATPFETPPLPAHTARVLGPADAATQPSIACAKAGCWTVWANAEGGAHARFEPTGANGRGWARKFSPTGRRPAMAVSRSGDAAMAWFDEHRLQFAEVGPEGFEASTVVARVSGLHPPPVVLAATEPNRWYIAWRSYEATVPEPFVARVDCPQ